MEGQKVLERIEILQQQEASLNASKEEKRVKKIQSTEAFLRCENSCVCAQFDCEAKGLRQCSQCKHVMKSRCTKKKCKENGVEMKLPFCDRKKQILSDIYSNDSDNNNNI